MNRTIKNETRENEVPLQRSTGVWLDEPGYGGTSSARDQFGVSIDQQLAELVAKHPAPRQVPVGRPQ